MRVRHPERVLVLSGIAVSAASVGLDVLLGSLLLSPPGRSVGVLTGILLNRLTLLLAVLGAMLLAAGVVRWLTRPRGQEGTVEDT